MLRKQWQRQIVKAVCVIVCLIVITGVFSSLSVLLAANQKYSTAHATASIARVSLLPLRALSLFQISSFEFVDLHLRLLQHTRSVSKLPDFFQRRWSNSHSPTEIEIADLKNQITQLQRTVQAVQVQLNRPPLITQLFQFTLPELHVQYLTALTSVEQNITFLIPFIRNYELLTGFPNTSKTYFIMLQNNMELRPTGGFLGSYALVTFANGNLQSLEIEDIYFPDGQLYGHVDPPQPIQEAFLQGFWKLRDANWHPDFAESAQNVAWFFEQASIYDIDGVMAINFTSIEKILEIVGPVYLPEFNQTVSADDVYLFVEIEGEKDFVPGSTKKRELLSSLQTSLIKKIAQLSSTQYLQLSTVLNEEIENQQLQLFFVDPELQSLATHLKIDGQLQNQPCQQENCFADYFSIFDANLGVNKTNCCVERRVEIHKSSREKSLHTTIDLEYTHLGPKSMAHSQLVGHYRNYVRLYLPKHTKVQSLQINGQEYPEYISNLIEQSSFDPSTQTSFSSNTVKGFTEIGFWIWVDIDETKRVRVETETAINTLHPYQLTIQKQSGTQGFYNYFSIKYNENQLFNAVLQKNLLL